MKYIPILLLSLIGCLPADDMEFPTQVNLHGELAKRVELTLNRYNHDPFEVDLVVQDVARIEGLQRRFEEYEGDISGRMLGSWSYISRLLTQRPAKLDSIFDHVLTHQTKEGYFGKDQQSIGWDYWGRQIFGHGRLLGGLVQYYRLTQDKRALRAAVNLADYFVRTIPEWTQQQEQHPWANSNRWVNWQQHNNNRQHFVKTHMISILESMMMLHDIHPDDTYLQASRTLVELFPEFGHYHSHSYLNSMSGMAMLYDATKDQSLLEHVLELYWQYVAPRSVPVDGGIREWFPADHRTEGCSITDWIRLNLYLWKITRDAVYLDAVENTWYNALNFHQTANGAFGHAVCNPDGYAAKYSEAWWCCTMHGLWAYADIINFMAAVQHNDMWINMYAPADFRIGTSAFEIETTFPVSGLIRIICLNSPQQIETTHIRIPDWAETFTVTIDKKPVQGRFEDGYFSFQHTWESGDTLELKLPLELRLIDSRGNNLLRLRQPGHSIYQAFVFYGPLLLGVDTNKNSAMPDRLHFFKPAQNVSPTSSKQHPFELGHAHIKVSGLLAGAQTDFILTPISEQTGYQHWTDDWRFFRRNGERPIDRVPVRIRQSVQLEER